MLLVAQLLLLLHSWLAFASPPAALDDSGVQTQAALRRRQAAANPFEALVTSPGSALFLPTSATTTLQLPVTVAQTLSLTAGTYVVASDAWRRANSSGLSDVLSLPPDSQANASSVPPASGAIADGGIANAQVVCTTSSSLSTSDLLGPSLPPLFQLSQGASLLIRNVSFVGCGRIFRTSDASRLSIVSARFELAWQVVVASGSSSARMYGTAFVNSTVRYTDALQALDAAAAASAQGQSSTVEKRCGPLALVCALDGSSVSILASRADRIGLAGGDAPPAARTSALAAAVSPDMLIASSQSSTSGARMAVLDNLASGGVIVLRDSATAEWAWVAVRAAQAEQGSVAYAAGSSRFNCTRCSFSSNSAEYTGGCVALAGNARADFVGLAASDNSALYGGFGWVQDAAQVQIRLNSTIVLGRGRYAGAIALVQLAVAVFETSEVANCSSTAYAGALYAGDSSSLVIKENSQIKWNSALHGGAVFATGNSALWFINSMCSGNSALVYGGCIRAVGRVLLRITGSFMSLNSASSGGVALLAGTSVTIESSFFHANVVARLSSGLGAIIGGCIAAQRIELAVLDSFFSSNAALDESISDSIKTYGGALDVRQDSVVSFTRTVFSWNQANYAAGAVNIVGSRFVSVNSLFYFNKATHLGTLSTSRAPEFSVYGIGGALLIGSSQFDLVNTSFIGNTVYYQGGAMFLTASNGTLSGGVHANNTAVVGGWMGTGAYSVIDLQDLSCQDNRGRIGGSLFTQRSTISMRRMIFRNNRVESTVFPGVPLIIDLQADQWQNTGGAIAVFKSNVTADEMTFANNYSEDEAGAIYVARGRLTISRTYAEGNSARWGGFINAHSAPDTFLFVDNLNCYRNIADDKIYNLYALGGCIFAEDVVTLVVVDSIMTQNVALGGVRLRGYGAAMYLETIHTCEIRNLSLIENYSSYAAGGLFVAEVTEFHLSNSTFIENSAMGHVDLLIASTDANLQIDGTSTTIRDTDFVRTDGMSVILDYKYGNTVLFERCKWLAVHGSVIRIDGNEDVSVEIRDSIVDTSLHKTLIVRSRSEKAVPVKLSGCKFSNIAYTRLNSDLEGDLTEDNFGSFGIFHLMGASLTMIACSFRNVTALLRAPLVSLVGSNDMTADDTSIHEFQGRSILEFYGPSSASIRRLNLTGLGNTFERGILSMENPEARVSIESMDVSFARSRCGVIACAESARSISLDNISVRGARCFPIDSWLSAHSITCTMVTSRATSLLAVSNMQVTGFDSWVIFSTIATGQEAAVANVSMTNFNARTGGVLRALSLDGGGRLNISNVIMANGTIRTGAAFWFAYVALPQNASSTQAGSIWNIGLTNVTVCNVSIADGGGAMLLMNPSEFYGALARNATDPSVSPAQSPATSPRLILTMRQARMWNVSTQVGGTLVHCSGAGWNASISSAGLFNVSSVASDGRGGVVSLLDGCRLQLAQVTSNHTVAAQGGFASVQGGSLLQVMGALVQNSKAVGGLAPVWSESRAGGVRGQSSSCDSKVVGLSQLERDEYSAQSFVSSSVSAGGSGGVFFVAGAGSSLDVRASSFRDNFAVETGGLLSCDRPPRAASQLVVENVTVSSTAALKGAVQFVSLGASSTNSAASDAASLLASWRAKGNNVASDDNCARAGVPVGTSPWALDVSWARANGSSASSSTRRDASATLTLLSGDYLPKTSVRVLDGLGQPYLDASIVSLVLRVRGNQSSCRIEGRANAYGTFGSAEFADASIRLLGKPGPCEVEVSSDDLYPAYPSSLLRKTVAVVVAACPPSRFVRDLACIPCPAGMVSTAAESSECIIPPTGLFSFDGKTTRSCSETDGDTTSAALGASTILLSSGGAASGTEATQARALELKRMQCNKAGLLSSGALGAAIAVPIVVIFAVGGFGFFYYRRKMRELASAKRPWLVNSSEIQWLSKIGEGAFGEVFMCKYHETIVCVKRVKLDAGDASNSATRDADVTVHASRRIASTSTPSKESRDAELESSVQPRVQIPSADAHEQAWSKMSEISTSIRSAVSIPATITLSTSLASKNQSKRTPVTHLKVSTDSAAAAAVTVMGNRARAIATKKTRKATVNVSRPRSELGTGGQTAFSQQVEESYRTQLEEANDSLEQEIELHVSLRHPNVVLMMGAVLESDNICLMTEFMHLGSLERLLLASEFPLPLSTRLKFCREVTRGLAYLHLHDPPILHCDMKSANILVSGDLIVKLADFGFSTLKSQKAFFLEGTQIGTVLYMAPEVLLGELYTEASDIFSLGIILFEIIFRVNPAYPPALCRLDAREFGDAILSGVRPSFPLGTPLSLCEFLPRTWSADYRSRLDVSEVTEQLDTLFTLKY